jgi:hypothetical protein
MRLFSDKQVILMVTLSVLALWLSPTAMAASTTQYQRQVLFSLGYGPEPEQIGISPGPGEIDMGEDIPALSVGGITVAADDLIYISDQVQHRIKRFTSKGEMTLVVDKTVVRLLDALGQPDAEVPVSAGGPVVADPQGRFYAAGQVFDAAGVMQLSSRDESGKIVEARGTDRLRSQVSAAAAQGIAMYEGSEPHIVRQYCDRDGNVYVGMSPAPTEYNLSLTRFDANLQFIQTVPGTSVGWDGRSYGGIPGKESDPNDQLRVWGPNGELERIVTLRPPKGTGAEHYDHAKNRWRYVVYGSLYDGNGSIYMVCQTPLPEDDWIELLPDFTIRKGTTIYKFDHDGNFVLRMDLRGLPFDINQPIAIDPAGNIYHLEYYKDHVDFVKETLVVASP